MNKIIVSFFILLTTIGFNSVFAEGCPYGSVSCRPSTTNLGDSTPQSVEVNGMIGGQIIETQNKIIVQGASFILHNTDKSALKINSNSNKKIILSNINIISDGVRQSSNDSSSAILSIRTSDSDSQVVLNGVNVKSHNSRLTVNSHEKQVCAAITCLQLYGSVKLNNVDTTTSGTTDLTANRH